MRIYEQKTAENIVYRDLSYKLNGICFRVHRELGRFCRERQYADRLEELLQKAGIMYKREFEIKKLSQSSPDGNRVDFLIEQEVILDTKAKPYLLKDDYVQMQRYLQSADLKLGLLVNFRNTHLKPARVLNSRHSHRTSKGFSIIELLVYSAVFVVVFAMIVGTGLALSRSYRGVANTASIERDAIAVLEKISREARGAISVDTTTSVLGANPSTLAFNTRDSGGAARSVKFFVNGSSLRFSENSTDKGAITGSKTAVSNFVARKITTGKSEAVKIEFALQSSDVNATTTKSFYTTIVLRNSY